MLWVRERDHWDIRPVPGTELAHQPFFSPDGGRVGFITEDRHLKIVSFTGEPPVTLLDSIVRRGGGAWGPDDYLYFSEGDGGENPPGLRRISVAGGPVEVVTVVDTTRQERRHYFPDVLPNGKGVVFSVARQILYRAALMDIAVGDLSTGEHRILLTGVHARWSPTGHILFVTEDGTLMAAPFDDEALQLTGPAVPLFGGIHVEGLASVDIAVSDNGTLVYGPGDVSRARQGRLVWVDREGDEEEIDPSWIGAFGPMPALSPDGSRLAVSMTQGNDRQIWIKQLDRGPLSKLTFEGQSNQPVWTPDGLSLAFARHEENRPATYYKRLADGSGPAELVLALVDVPVYDVTYSPDGGWLVYRADDKLFVQRVDGVGDPIPIGDGGFEGTATVSPDGRWLAYVSSASGQVEVYVRPFPDVEAGRWQVSTNGGIEPVWAHTGEELFFKSEGQLMSVEVLPGATFVAGAQRALFPIRSYRSSTQDRFYDITPDDQRLVMIRSGSGEIGELAVIENFFEELEERVSN
jgi:serine/threonine-protein kinase